MSSILVNICKTNPFVCKASVYGAKKVSAIWHSPFISVCWVFFLTFIVETYKDEIYIANQSKGIIWQSGSDNAFFVLEEGKINQGTCMLYHPQRIDRGIFVDASKTDDGQYVLSYNIPTTEAGPGVGWYVWWHSLSPAWFPDGLWSRFFTGKDAGMRKVSTTA